MLLVMLLLLLLNTVQGPRSAAAVTVHAWQFFLFYNFELTLAS